MEYSIPELRIILGWGLRANKAKKPRKEDKELYQKILVDVRETERAEKELQELIWEKYIKISHILVYIKTCHILAELYKGNIYISPGFI